MRKKTLSLLKLIFLPQGPVNLYLEASHKASLKDLAKWAVLATLIFFLTTEGSAVYLVWMLTALIFALYQYLYVFAYPTHRPVLYEETSLVGILLIVVNQVAVAALCGIGLAGIVLHAYCAFFLARVIGRLAIARETRKSFTEVCRTHPQDSVEARIELFNALVENRVEQVQGATSC